MLRLGIIKELRKFRFRYRLKSTWTWDLTKSWE